jgi:nitric oxide synthase-interacting protein
MPQRHSKNNNDLAFFTYDERKKLGYGTQKERLGKDSIKPFDSCCICLQPIIDPLSCSKGHLFCKECIFECLLAQKKDIKRKLTSYTIQEKSDNEDKLEKIAAEKQRELDAFDRQNNSAVPHQQVTGNADDRHIFHGANSVRVTSYEEEALRTMKAFWLPSATPGAVERVQAPSTDTCCPEGNEKLKLKDLFPIIFTDVPHREKKEVDLEGSKFMCPSCSVTLTNTLTLVAISSCGHVFCKKCADQFIAPGKQCLACNKQCKPRNLITLEKGGTGFSGHDDKLEATSFKHVGSGTGMGLARPTTKL